MFLVFKQIIVNKGALSVSPQPPRQPVYSQQPTVGVSTYQQVPQVPQQQVHQQQIPQQIPQQVAQQPYIPQQQTYVPQQPQQVQMNNQSRFGIQGGMR